MSQRFATRGFTRRLALASLGGLTLAVGLIAAVVTLALGLGKAVVAIRGFVTQVGVNTNKLSTINGSDALHVHGALALAVAFAVTTRAIDLAIVVGIEVNNVHLCSG